MKPALLVIDVQKAFFKINATTTQSLENAIEYINVAIDMFREKNYPVICIQHVDAKDNLVPGEEGFELPASLKITAADIHIHKTYGNAFCKTELAKTIADLGVDTVFISGFCAEYCVLSTFRGAEEYDLTPILIRGSLASIVPENIKFVENINELISIEALKIMLG
jgi:nicotinamidase-related amidase